MFAAEPDGYREGGSHGSGQSRDNRWSGKTSRIVHGLSAGLLGCSVGYLHMLPVLVQLLKLPASHITFNTLTTVDLHIQEVVVLQQTKNVQHKDN